MIVITSGTFQFRARLEEAAAPKTCAWFRGLLPLTSKVIQARWSGEAVWVPMGEETLPLPLENHTAYPSRGDILIYPGGLIEPEFLFVYGSAIFGSKVGLLPGNHFMTLVEGGEQLTAFGRCVQWQGAQDVTFSWRG